MPSLPILSDVAGPKVGHLLPTERIGACCIRFERFHTHRVADLRRGFQPFFPVWWLIEGMTPFCQARCTGAGDCGLGSSHPTTDAAMWGEAECV